MDPRPLLQPMSPSKYGTRIERAAGCTADRHVAVGKSVGAASILRAAFKPCSAVIPNWLQSDVDCGGSRKIESGALRQAQNRMQPSASRRCRLAALQSPHVHSAVVCASGQFNSARTRTFSTETAALHGPSGLQKAPETSPRSRSHHRIRRGARSRCCTAFVDMFEGACLRSSYRPSSRQAAVPYPRRPVLFRIVIGESNECIDQPAMNSLHG